MLGSSNVFLLEPGRLYVQFFYNCHILKFIYYSCVVLFILFICFMFSINYKYWGEHNYSSESCCRRPDGIVAFAEHTAAPDGLVALAQKTVHTLSSVLDWDEFLLFSSFL